MTKPKVFRYTQFDLDALLALASRLRRHPCSCDISKPPLAGSLNWVVFVSFDDGISWAFRSPHSGRRAFLGEACTSRMIASEVATLRYIGTHTSIPVPEVFAYSISHDNDIGVPYILMSKAPGRPLSEYGWLRPAHQPPAKSPSQDTLRPLSEEGKERIMITRLGLRLSCRELPLTPHAFFAPIPDTAEYASWASYAAAVARRNDFVAVGQKIDHSKNRLAYCIAGQLMQDMIPSLCSEAPVTSGFPLSHPDLHLGNIFVDENLRITCVIDWGSASSVPITEALATPGLRISNSATEEALVAAFRAGFGRAPCDEEPTGPTMWQRADMMRLFQRLVRMLSTRDYHDFVALFALLNRAEEDDEWYRRVPALFDERAEQRENRLLLAELRDDDLPQDYVEQQERATFGSSGAVNSERLAVVRKLTLMYHINKEFIADRRLWRWIEDSMNDICPT
ncbi:hypothetical protein MFIFM68171_01737 [Madurella fahalii]|uniref:Aminoglycoside phosphotransferase domain-containing protein n=1 Tax=Madurella fahalii TaxID=1157608 RepID=A0ABQ0G190_9PEZI